MYEVLSLRSILHVTILIPMCVEHPCLPHQGRTRIFFVWSPAGWGFDMYEQTQIVIVFKVYWSENLTTTVIVSALFTS